ncbi:MAG: hypothetical protein MJD61_02100, partial [Proteobacteria bacterium]|nr:hypothetical protein [Pseudomonadota bacterium]
EDEVGQGARAEIERFVRERLPRGGALAYVPAELMSLNARRASQSEFRPYSTRDSAGGLSPRTLGRSDPPALTRSEPPMDCVDRTDR